MRQTVGVAVFGSFTGSHHGPRGFLRRLGAHATILFGVWSRSELNRQPDG